MDLRRSEAHQLKISIQRLPWGFLREKHSMAAKRDLEFYRAPPPPGRSRESTIVLDGDGIFHQEDEAFGHAKLRDAMHTWIGRHPDNKRFILDNGYDWTYFTVRDVAYFVRHLEELDGTLHLVLSDGTREPLVPEETFIGPNDALYTQVKRPGSPDLAASARGPYWAKFTRHAQTELAPFLAEKDGKPAFVLGNRIVPIGKRDTFE